MSHKRLRLRSLIATLAIVGLMVLASALALVPELTVSASNIVLSYFELSRAMEIQRALLTLIANFATYGHKREYKYPIAFSHNRAEPFGVHAFSSRIYQIDLAGGEINATTLIIS